MNVSAALRIARFDKPVGIFLLWAPTAWALWIASAGKPSFTLLLLFVLGTITMRAAGCVVNDIADRDIDWRVWRTQKRPLTSGEISLQEALCVLVLLLSAALVTVLQLPITCFYFALIALAITILYPFCKRFFRCPQLVLGVAFTMGIPMAFAANQALNDPKMLYLLVINMAWVLAYDTEYAMVDRSDDLRIGVLSSAILFASWDRSIIAGLQILLHSLWLPLAVLSRFSWYFYLCWLLGLSVLLYQQILLATRIEANYFRAFSSNIYYGMLLWLGILLAFYF